MKRNGVILTASCCQGPLYTRQVCNQDVCSQKGPWPDPPTAREGSSCRTREHSPALPMHQVNKARILGSPPTDHCGCKAPTVAAKHPRITLNSPLGDLQIILNTWHSSLNTRLMWPVTCVYHHAKLQAKPSSFHEGCFANQPKHCLHFRKWNENYIQSVKQEKWNQLLGRLGRKFNLLGNQGKNITPWVIFRWSSRKSIYLSPHCDKLSCPFMVGTRRQEGKNPQHTKILPLVWCL